MQHGPHLPLGTNTLIVEAVAEAVSLETRTLLAPTLHYGVHEKKARPYAGAAGLERKTLHRALNELLARWEDHGIREFFILTAHRHDLHLDALLMAMTSSAGTTVVNLLALETGDILAADPRGEHGGELETSLVLHLAPQLVLENQITDVPPPEGTAENYARGRIPTPPPGSRGVLGFPSRASSEKGKAVYLRYVKSVREILSGPSPPGTGRKETG